MFHLLIFGDLFSSANIKQDKRRLFTNGDCYDGFGLILESKRNEKDIIKNFGGDDFTIVSSIPYVATRVSQDIKQKRHRGGGIQAGFYYCKVGKHKPSAVTGHKALLICNDEDRTYDKIKSQDWKYFINDGESRKIKTDFNSEIHNGNISYAINFHRGPDLKSEDKKSTGWNWSYGCLTTPKVLHNKLMEIFEYNDTCTIELMRSSNKSMILEQISSRYPSIYAKASQIFKELEDI